MAPARDAHKGMQGIPDRIHAGDLIGEELHQIHKPGSEHDQRIGQHLHALRERHPAGGPKQAQHQDRGMQIDPAGPTGAQREGECPRQIIHLSVLPSACDRLRLYAEPAQVASGPG